MKCNYKDCPDEADTIVEAGTRDYEDIEKDSFTMWDPVLLCQNHSHGLDDLAEELNQLFGKEIQHDPALCCKCADEADNMIARWKIAKTEDLKVMRMFCNTCFVQLFFSYILGNENT